MRTNTLVRVLLVGLMLCGPIAPAFAPPPPPTTYMVGVDVKAKAKGAKGKYFQSTDIVFYQSGVFTTNDIAAGTWTGDGKKMVLHLPDSDVEYLVETVAAGQLGEALEFVSVTSIKGKATVKQGKGAAPSFVKGKVKIKGLLNAPGLGLFNVKFQIAMKFSGIEKP